MAAKKTANKVVKKPVVKAPVKVTKLKAKDDVGSRPGDRNPPVKGQ